MQNHHKGTWPRTRRRRGRRPPDMNDSCLGVGARVSAGLGVGAVAGVGTAVCAGVGAGVGAGISAGVSAGVGAGVYRDGPGCRVQGWVQE